MTYTATVQDAVTGTVVGTTDYVNEDGVWYATNWRVDDPSYPEPLDGEVDAWVKGDALVVRVTRACTDCGAAADEALLDQGFTLCWDHRPRNACEAGACRHHYC